MTEPSPLAIDLDGVSTVTSFSTPSVVGTTRTLAAAAVTRSGTSWVFDSWFDGTTEQSRTFNVAPTSQTFSALFRTAGGSVGTGTGLKATYFADTGLTQPVLVRVDRSPFFNWPASPAPGVPKDDFAVRWVGDLHAQFSGTYTFAAPIHRDETLVVKVGGQVVVDASDSHGTVSGTLSLVAGQRYPIQLVYTDRSGGAAMELRYGRSSSTMAPLPGSQLYPAP